MSVKCECCGELTKTEYQPRERRNSAGEWEDVGGFYITTCFNKSCLMRGMTLETTNHKRKARAARGGAA